MQAKALLPSLVGNENVLATDKVIYFLNLAMGIAAGVADTALRLDAVDREIATLIAAGRDATPQEFQAAVNRINDATKTISDEADRRKNRA